MNLLKSFMPYVLLASACLLAVGMLNDGQDWGGDFSSYIMQAASLVEGAPKSFIEANQFFIEHSTRHIAPVAYPWGYSAMLAPVYAIYGQDIVSLKSVSIFCYLLFLVVLWVGFRKRHQGAWLWCLIGLFALNPTMLVYLNRVLSDVPFLLFSTLCVVLIGRFVIERRRLISPGSDAALLGVLIALACTIRTNGVVLLATLMVTRAATLLINYRRCKAGDAPLPSEDSEPQSTDQTPGPGKWIYLLPFISFFVVMLLYRVLLPSGESEQLSILKEVSLGTMWYHLFYYGNMPAEFFEGVPLPYTVYLASLPLMIVGMYRRRQTDHHMAVYIALMFGLYVVYPPLAGFRFMFPIMPFYISFVLSGLEALQGRSTDNRKTPRRAACLAPVAIIIVCFTVLSVANVRDNLGRERATREGPYTADSSAMLSFIEEETEPDSVYVFYKPRVLRLMTDRQAYMTRDLDHLDRGDYLVMYLREPRWNISPEDADLIVDRGGWEIAFENADFRVLRKKKRTE